MVLKNILRIIIDYRLSLIKIIFFEFIYIFRGYKGNNFDFSRNLTMSDNIPCPYYFLLKIKKILKNNKFNTFIDLGCGSGRVLNFFNKKFNNKNFIGVEYFYDQYSQSKKLFNKNENIEILQGDFTKMDLYKENADCYFLNNPFKNDSEFIIFFENLINYVSRDKDIFFIFINYNFNVIKNLKKIIPIEHFYVSDIKGYSVCCLHKNK